MQQARATLAQSEASLQQAKAALEQAQANAELARLTKERDIPLGQQRAISQQIVDGAVQSYDARVADVAAATANITAAEANVTANRANVSRLQQMQSFERIVAPFDGVITQRNVERGDLVSTGNPGGAKPLFSIAQSGTLRIQIDVPQSEAVNIKDGQKASVDVRERLGRAYTGTVIRNAAALDNAARTMLTEVQVDNSDGSLLPGMYAQVKFTLPQQRTSFLVPTSSLVVDHSGMHVVTVDAGHTVHFVPVTIGKDMGKEVEILKSSTESKDPRPWSRARATCSTRANMSKCDEYAPVVNKIAQAAIAGLLILMMAACNVGPNYKRPATSTPQTFRGALAPEIAPPDPVSIADEKWPAVFRDPVLQQLVTEALQNNLDLRVAAQRVLEAQAHAGIVRSQQFPTINGGAGYTALQIPSSLAGNNSNGTPNTSFFNGGGLTASAAWNLDFWGLYRRQTEAARAELLASLWASGRRGSPWCRMWPRPTSNYAAWTHSWRSPGAPSRPGRTLCN